MSTTTYDATITVIECDYPCCYEQTASSQTENPAVWDHVSRRAEGWERVPIRLKDRDIEFLALCPQHAHLKETAALVLSLIERNDAQIARAVALGGAGATP